ncbi:MAG TPA: hypothetical protein VGH92_10425 [Gaiellaceae bacterium]|jgi:hypothetical protein
MLRPALLLSAATLATATPQALLTTLLKVRIAAAELPLGFSNARAERQRLSANGKKYHAVGLVDVSLEGPDAVDAFAWIVFTKHADAISDLDHPAVGNGVKVLDVVPGLKDSLVLTGTLNGKTITDAVAVDGAVLIQGVVVSSAVREPTAIILLKAAIAHLRRLR